MDKRRVVAGNRQVAEFAGFEVGAGVGEDKGRGFAEFAEFALAAEFPIQIVCDGDTGVLCKNKIYKPRC